MFAAGAFAFGAVIASFLNVCIWRIPRGESVVSPPSHCPKCGKRIRWWQNIPIISWLALRGRCAGCGERISARYIAIETLGGVLFLAAFVQAAWPWFLGEWPPFAMTPISLAQLPIWFLAYAGLILGAFVDLDHYWIPDRVTIGGMVLGVPLNLIAAWTMRTPLHNMKFVAVWYAAGLVLGFGGLWLLGFVFSKIFKKEAMGFGDVKLLGAVGAFFGPVAVVFTLVAAAIAGSVAGIAMIAAGRTKMGNFTPIPFGPFLALGAAVWMLWGEVFVAWYMMNLAM